MKINRILFSLVLLITFYGNLYAQYNVGYIINYLRHPKNDLTAVCAHRGYWRENGVPENSLYAIQRAVDVGIEMVELDIKMSSDGVPVLSHDVTLGRCTNMTLLQPQKGDNPRVDWFTSGDLQKVQLRDKNGKLTNEHLPTLEQAMDYIRSRKLAVVLMLDIKDRLTTRACWEIIKRKENGWGTPAYDWVVFKLNATVYGESPATLEKDLNLGQTHNIGFGGWVEYKYNFKFIPVFTTNMLQKLNCLRTYNNFKSQPYFVAVEVDLKENNGIHSDIVKQANKDNKTLVCFNALPDAGGDRFWKVDYSGTYRLRDIYYTANGGSPRDTDDRRGSWQWLTSWNCRFITTDEPYNLINDYLGTNGKRNTLWYTRDWARVASESDSTTIAWEDDAVQTQDARGDGVSSQNPQSVTGDSLRVFPNPNNGLLNVIILNQVEGKTQFTLYDASGAPVYQDAISIEGGLQDVTVLDLSGRGVKPGIYTLQAILPDGRKHRASHIVVK